MKQNVELKKENSELIRLLKKSKEVIKEEIGKYKSENSALKKFVEAAWPWIEPKLDEKLKEEVKPLIVLPRDKMNSITTNHTDNFSAEKPKSERYEIDSLRHRLSERGLESSRLLHELNATKRENETIAYYLGFMHTRSLKSNIPDQREVLPVDSANVGSDADEDEIFVCNWPQIKAKGINNNTSAVLPGFIKSLTVGKF